MPAVAGGQHGLIVRREVPARAPRKRALRLLGSAQLQSSGLLSVADEHTRASPPTSRLGTRSVVTSPDDAAQSTDIRAESGRRSACSSTSRTRSSAEGLHRDHLRQPCSRERLVLAPRHAVPPATPIQQLTAVPTSARPSAIPSRHKLAAVPQVPMEGSAAAIWSRGSASLAPESAICRFGRICPSRSGGRGLLQGSVPGGEPSALL